MDTIMHGVHGALIRYSLIPHKGYAIVGAIEGIAPDLMGALEKLIKSDKPFLKRLSDQRYWKWYEKSHLLPSELLHIFALAYTFPAIGLHIYLDSFTHSEGKRWWVWNERLWLEILLWAITLILCYLIWR